MSRLRRALLTATMALGLVPAASLMSGHLCGPLSGPMSGSASAQAGVTAEQWSAYRQKFLGDEGRIIDDANGRISHSEGQGYGLLLAYLAGSRADFDRIWAFTRTELMLRDDGLAVWKWDPAARPHVKDINNASDGDMLIAYALALAGDAWQRRDFREAAGSIARSLLKSAVLQQHGRMVMLPGMAGFRSADRPDGPVINLSYWVFEAIPVLSRIAPDEKWARLTADGLKLMKDGALGPRKLPPDWLSIRTSPKPARGFPPDFSYNAIRIPLYLARAGQGDAAMLTAFRDGITAPDGGLQLVNVGTGQVMETLRDPGYRAIPAMLSCLIEGKALPDDVKAFAPTAYYPSTLHLLVLSFLSGRYPQCL